MRGEAGIGTLGEKTLHAALKRYYLPPGGLLEAPVGRYVADVWHEGGIVEVQTRNFYSLRKKLPVFLEAGPVTLVYPLAHTKYLCWIDGEGNISKPRKSAKTGRLYDAWPELNRIRGLLSHPRLRLCFPELTVTEYRLLNGWSKDKKRGSTRYERIPEALAGEIMVEQGGYHAFLPPEMPAQFTVRHYAKAAKISVHAARMGLLILFNLGVVERVGKTGNAFIYERAQGGEETCVTG